MKLCGCCVSSPACQKTFCAGSTVSELPKPKLLRDIRLTDSRKLELPIVSSESASRLYVNGANAINEMKGKECEMCAGTESGVSQVGAHGDALAMPLSS